MREISFRVWDKEKREFHYCGLFSLIVDGAEGSKNPMFTDYKNFTKRFKIQQYTGLNDKDNKKIYEGDILRVNTWELVNKNGFGEVFYNENYNVIYDDYSCAVSTFTLKSNNKGLPFECPLKECDTILSYSIAGDIYENPELLKKKEE